MIETKLNEFYLRFADEKDLPLILEFVKELATYEDLLHEVKATEASLHDAIFRRRVAEVIFGEYQGKPVGFALYFYNLSTFIGRPGIFLEDLFVHPEYRGRGFGKELLAYLAKLAKERNCWGVEWNVLAWNDPSIKFYQSLGAVMREEWRVFRLKGQALLDLADRFGR